MTKLFMIWTEHFPAQKIYKVWTRLCENGTVGDITFEYVNQDFFREYMKIQCETHGKYYIKLEKRPAFTSKLHPIFFR